MRALIVEDEKKIAAHLRRALVEAGFSADVLHRGDEALTALREIPYDIAVLDVMLPGLDGLAILKRLRSEDNAVPVLLLTARGEVENRVEGLESGADDYLVKPFAIEEVIARVRALLRRRSGESLTIHGYADLTMDVSRRIVTRDGKRIDLTAREFALLQLLLRSPGHVFTRTQICEKVWDYHFDPGTNLVNVYIQRLRQKVDADFTPKLIRTVHGVGYYLASESL
ncbi:MAG: response regulator [Chthoniobacterales bacterium]